MRRRTRRRLLFVLAALVLALAGLEGAARLAGEPRFLTTMPPLPPEVYRFRLINRWLVMPNDEVPMDCAHYEREILGRSTPSARGEIRNSPEGFRDTPLAHPRPPRQRRILVLGDSSVFGTFICRLDTFSEQLEAALNPAGPGTPATRAVEVINTGAGGYSTYQSMEQLRRAAAWGIDGVIIYNLNSDLMAADGWTDDTWFTYVAPAVRVLGHLNLYRRAHSWLWRSRRGPAPPNPAARPPNRVHLGAYQRNLLRLHDMAQDLGAWVIFVVPPHHTDVQRRGGRFLHPAAPLAAAGPEQRRTLEQQVAQALDQHEHFVPQHYRAAMALAARQSGAALVDGPNLFRAAYTPEGARLRGAAALFVDDIHPGPAGQALLARALLPLVKARLEAQKQ